MGTLRVQVTGRNLDVGDALRARIEEELSAGVGRYATRDGDAVVTLQKERHLVIVETIVHLDSGITLEAKAEAGEAHAAFDLALAKIEKRARRYKRRLKDHHAQARTNPMPREEASYAVIAEADDEPEEAAAGDAGPVVIAEQRTVIKTMPVATAVMQLELSEQNAVMFRNPKSGSLNVVYRRADGNIGWVDPDDGDAGAGRGVAA
jgi:ribosomal subunit interface protein